MAQVTKIRLPDGRVVIPSDWTAAEPLYSTIEVTSGPYITLDAFSYGIGGDVPGSTTGAAVPTARKATLADSNLQGEGGRIPENEELLIYAMMIEAFTIFTTSDPALSLLTDALPNSDPPDVSLLNMLRLQRDLVIKMSIASVKEYTKHPLGWYPAETGIQQYNSAALSQISGNLTGVVNSNNGGTDADQRRLFASPYYVEGGEALIVSFVAPAGVIGGSSAVPSPTSPLAVDPTFGRIRLRTFLDGYRRRPVA